MKKIILGATMMFTAPFLFILGAKLILVLFPLINVSVMNFSGFLGACTVLFNSIIGAILVVRGHKDINNI